MINKWNPKKHQLWSEFNNPLQYIFFLHVAFKKMYE